MKFIYPIKVNEDYLSGEVDKLKGGSNQLGFFPIGRLNCWHGGIHIENNSPIAAIAKGKIIAYRFPNDYLEETNEDGNKHLYSNAFVLIQHDYESPNGLNQTFYSLYNHLLPFSAIKSEKKAFPAFLLKDIIEVKGGQKNGNIKGEYVKTCPPEKKTFGFLAEGTQLKAVGELNNGYQKFTIETGTILNLTPANAGKDKYISKDSFFATVAESDAKNEVITGAIDVKAGDIIGYPGNFGFDRKANYITSHIEVFSAGDVSSFLKGKREDIANTLFQYKIAKGTELQIKYPGIIEKGWNIEVIVEANDFCQIMLSPIIADVTYSDLIDNNKKENGVYYFTPGTGEAFDRLNQSFKMLLKNDSRLMLKTITSETTRNVSLSSNDKQQYWIKKANLPVGETKIRELTSDINELFLEKPTGDGSNVTIDRDIFISTRETKKVIDNNQVEWQFVTVKYYFNSNTVTKSGWIKTELLKKESAHNWAAFGFKVLEDLEDKYIYNIENTPDFLKNILKEIDTVENEVEVDDKFKWEEADKEGKLTAGELRRGVQKTPIIDGLSKLVCKHTSEWDYNSKFDTLKNEIIEYTDPEIKNTANESELIQKRDQRIERLKKRIENLSWWKDVASKIQPPASFPSSSQVYHFHPIAFVEQMKKIEGCFCNKDITVEAFEEIFGKGPWFTGKSGCVDMKVDYPDVYKATTKKLVDALNITMKNYEVNTCLQKAHFLGQIGAETGFQSTAEYGNGDDYDPSSHRMFHNNFPDYIAFLNKYTTTQAITVETKTSAKPTEIITNLANYKTAYDAYEAATAAARLQEPIKSHKEKHDKYLTFKTEKDKFDEIYNGSYKNPEKSTIYTKWRHGYYRYLECIENGNTNDGDGFKYRGHGMLQLTWKKNYEKFQKRLNIDIVTNPNLLSSNLQNACNMAGAWWINPLTGWGNINPMADEDDLLMATLAINGGMNGLPHRYKYTPKALKALLVKNCIHYQALTLGEYAFDTSNIKTSKYCYKYDNPIGPRTERVNYVKNALKEAKNDYKE